MKRTKTQKGITLIALIITIIVLLILAIVTIGAIQKDGIIQKAGDAKTRYTEAQAKEKVALAIQEYMLANNGKLDTSDFVSNIGKYVPGARAISDDTVLVDGYEFKINNDGSIETKTTSNSSKNEYEKKYAAQIATALKYGQLVNGVYTLKDEYLAARADEYSNPAGRLPASATSFALPYGTTTIGTHDFANFSGNSGTFLLQSNITEIILPPTLTTIPDYTFESCYSLSKVNLPSSVTSIGSGAFAFTAIESVEIPEGITKIENHTFTGCSNLRNVIIPSTVTHIGISAFSDSAFETITLPEGLESIDATAFAYCTNLKEIYIPASVRDIGVSEYSTVFLGCTSLKNIYIEGTNFGNGLGSIRSTAFTNIAEGSTIYVRSKAVADHLEESYVSGGYVEYKYDKDTTTISTDYNWVYTK